MGSFGALNYSVVLVYLVAAVWLGLRFTRRQKTLDEYFVADRSAPWWAAGISVIAANFSAISYMGSPAWVFQHDLKLDLAVIFFPLQMLVVVLLFVPFLARLRLYTIYEYLELRFGISARLAASTLFVLARGGHLAFAIYAQSLALALVLHLPFLTCVWVSGIATSLYTVFGGMEAVLWTDVMQFFVLVGGMLFIIGAVLLPFRGNVGALWHSASIGGHTKLISLSLNPTVTVTVWALFIGNLVMNVSAYGSDQVIVQRYLTTSDRKAMTRAVMLNGFLTVPLVLLLDFIGLGFVAYYRAHPALRATLRNPDQVLPHFVMHVLPAPISGLVIAGILAATMSTLSSGLNSLSTVSMMDFYRRFVPAGAAGQRSEVGLARLFTVAWGVAITVAAMFMGHLGQIVEGSLKALGFLSGPLLGMFLLGILSRRPNALGVLSGASFGTACAAFAATTHVSWLLYGPIGCLATVCLGIPMSLLAPAPTGSQIEKLTVWGYERPHTGGELSSDTA